MKILITGASGVVANELANELVKEKNIKIILIVKYIKELPKTKNIEFIEHDLLKPIKI